MKQGVLKTLNFTTDPALITITDKFWTPGQPFGHIDMLEFLHAYAEMAGSSGDLVLLSGASGRLLATYDGQSLRAPTGAEIAPPQ